jgi:O-antigen ligase
LFMVLTILIFHLNKEALINRTADLTILGLSLPIILMTQHRTVLMAGALGISLLLWLYRHRAVVLVKAATAVLALLTLLGVVITAVPKFERYTTEKVSGIINPAADGTASWRIEGWQQQLARLSGTSLVFGQGLGSYYYWKDEQGYGVRVDPHNAYVQLVLKFGLLGLIVYSLIVLKFFRMTLSARKKLSLGRTRAYVEVGIVNYGAAHAYLMGYSFELSMLIFFALALGTVSLLKYSREVMQPA